ncbi:MAG TPA: FG-GAP-like repeat-containing protein, partial [Gemmataceae bacterium]|nr:FG-GAP-like repeat-containing protein [Gemmataceae bacterium]
MPLHIWLQNLRSALALRRGQDNHARRGPHRAATHRPNIEVLEDRCVPAFLAPVDYFVGGNLRDVVAADFNNDTVPDLAVVSFDSSTVSVLLGNGDGTFQPAQTSATGAGPVSAAVGDFNRDGKLDLATANQGGDNVSVLLGNGNGTFQAPININIGSAPTSVAVGDFNGDGKLDLGVVSNAEDPFYYTPIGEANVLLGIGDGSFSAPITTSLGSGYHTSGAVADFNGDGKLDLAAANADYGEVEVLLGDGHGNLSLQGTGGPCDYPVSVAAGDVNGDAKLDVVTANYYGSVSVLLGDGAGGIASSQTYAADRGLAPVVVDVVLGDFNRDGKLDIATANNDDVSILRGVGDGTFWTAETFAAGPGASAVTAADWSADGWLDGATANAGGNSASVLINDHSWPFVPPTVSVSDAAVAEGNTSTVNATFTLTLTYASNVDVTVHYATADITATAGSDYTAASADVVIPAGQTSRTFTVAVIGDRLPEPDETFAVNLSSPTNATIADSQGVGTILDDEPRITINDVSLNEGNKGTKSFNFTVSLSASYDASVTVSYATADGTAKVAN